MTDAPALAEANRAAVQLVRDLASEWRLRIEGPMVLSGVIGPRGELISASCMALRNASAVTGPDDFASADAISCAAS